MRRDLDLVLFGATGFVGRLTAAYLAEHAPTGLRIALSGRDRHRLEALRRQLPRSAAAWEIVVVDAADAGGLAALAARTHVLVTTVGPYVRFGMPLVQACAHAGTYYCDLTGEVLFVRASADAWHETARSTGARIVHACGFDSIPSDLGVMLTADAAAAAGDGELTRTLLSVRAMKGGLSGGTFDSMRQQAIAMRHDPTARAIVADPYALSPDRDAEPDRDPRSTAEGRPTGSPDGIPTAGSGEPSAHRGGLAGLARRLPLRRDGRSGHWTAPFVMAGFNTRIVRRSNALLGWRYGRGLRYHEVLDMGSGAMAPVRAAGMSATLLSLGVGLSFAPTRVVVDRLLPRPGEGPSPAQRDAGRFALVIDAQTSGGAAYRTQVAADRDPGYDGTAVMLGETALALALDTDRLPEAAGVLTPATAVGHVLVDRLVAQGFTLETRRTATGVASG